GGVRGRHGQAGDGQRLHGLRHDRACAQARRRPAADRAGLARRRRQVPRRPERIRSADADRHDRNRPERTPLGGQDRPRGDAAECRRRARGGRPHARQLDPCPRALGCEAGSFTLPGSIRRASRVAAIPMKMSIAVTGALCAAAVSTAAIAAKPTTRNRAEIPAEYRWDFSAIYPNWAAWEEGVKEMDARMDAFAKLQGTLAQGPESLLKAYQ